MRLLALLESRPYPLSAILRCTVFILLSGCSNGPEFTPVYNVPEDYQTYIDNFISEAANRGQTIEIKNLIIKDDPSMDGPHCAKCNTASMDKNLQKIISINPNIQCWFSEEQREAMVFHELGHCILGRLHTEALLPNGDFKSVMNANDIGVYSSCVYPVDDKPCNNTFKRPYYLDELFDEDTPVPDWGN